MATKREIELARHLRRNSTPAERSAWELLRSRRCQGVKFKRQHPVGGFIVDFYAPDLQLVIEIDGSIHADPEHRARDAERTQELEGLGLIVVRVRNQEVDAVTLQRIVADIQSHPLSVRKDGEGAGG